jgi:hypothetical protein
MGNTGGTMGDEMQSNRVGQWDGGATMDGTMSSEHRMKYFFGLQTCFFLLS